MFKCEEKSSMMRDLLCIFIVRSFNKPYSCDIYCLLYSFRDTIMLLLWHVWRQRRLNFIEGIFRKYISLSSRLCVPIRFSSLKAKFMLEVCRNPVLYTNTPFTTFFVVGNKKVYVIDEHKNYRFKLRARCILCKQLVNYRSKES